ncbi:MAG: hypothetical protein IPK13_21325 [Deltaproteobacteria bacterium]|nr:hypothetical protein [Deltaproteobacteria bacterium]
MNRNIRRRIEAEKIKIKSRLKSATQVNEGGPVLSGGNACSTLSELASGRVEQGAQPGRRAP